MRVPRSLTLALLGGMAVPLAAARAQPFSFSTGDPDGRIGMASRPSSAGKEEIEAADDFILGRHTKLTTATFVGLLTGGAAPPTVDNVVVEIYRVFPFDSDVGRTSGAPLFSTPQVPTRVNSPSDVAFASRESGGGLTYSTTVLSPNFTAANSVLNGINPLPNVLTGGEGPVTGQEVLFTVTFETPFDLPADHYFFVPQVGTTGGNFFWLSAPKPIVAPGTPFAPDLQAWTRDEALQPDWLRVGTDIVGGTAFNAAFSVQGSVVPEPSTWALVASGLAAVAAAARRRRSAA